MNDLNFQVEAVSPINMCCDDCGDIIDAGEKFYINLQTKVARCKNCDDSRLNSK